MTRFVSFFATAATAAFLAFGGGAAFAMATNGGDGPGHPGGTNGPGATGGPGGPRVQLAGCEFRADQMGLEGPARRAFLWRCEQGGDF